MALMMIKQIKRAPLCDLTFENFNEKIYKSHLDLLWQAQEIEIGERNVQNRDLFLFA